MDQYINELMGVAIFRCRDSSRSDQMAASLVWQILQKSSNCLLVQSMSLVHDYLMRTNLTLDDDVHRFASLYATARGITLGAAISELVRKAETTQTPVPELHRSASGLAMFPPSGRVLTAKMVREAENELG